MQSIALLLVAGSCWAADSNPTVVLSRVRDRVNTGLRRMVNYTCVESITRTQFTPNVVRAPDSCDDLAARKQHVSYKLAPASMDRLRLDVAVAPQQEIYSWAGAREFESRDLTDIIGGGPIGTGAFSAFLMSIFDNQNALFTYAGEIQADGRRLLEFHYRVSREASRYQIRVADGWVIAGYDGSILVDPDAADLVRLTIRTEELPPETSSCETRTTLDYHRVPIGNEDVLLPLQTRQRWLLRNGIESENSTAFSACREYLGQSTVRFTEDAGALSAGPSGGVKAAPAPLPIDLPVMMEMTAPLDTWTASAGDMITLHLGKPIVDADKRVLVPAGAGIEARLIRVQRYFTKPERSTVVIKPETLERDGVKVPLYVLPNFQQTPTQITQSGFKWRGVSMGETPMPNEIRFGVYHFVGDHVVLPKGYRSWWATSLEPQ